MRVPPYAILIAGLVLIGGVIAASVLAASGGGDDDPPASTDATATPTRAADDDPWGDPPVMTAHIHRVTPEHRGAIQQTQTIERPDQPGRICAEVSYEDLPQNNLHFQMAIAGEIVTQQTSIQIIQGTAEAPERGLLCYASPEGLELGIHDAAVAVQDPNNLAGPPSEVVAWKFEVIE
jgi:hypothetical protein